MFASIDSNVCSACMVVLVCVCMRVWDCFVCVFMCDHPGGGEGDNGKESAEEARNVHKLHSVLVRKCVGASE